MKFLFRFGKLIVKTVAWLTAILMAVFVGFIAFLQFPFGQKSVADLISSLASTPDQVVKLEQLSISPGLSVIALTSLSLADKQGEWLSAEDLQIRWAPLKLFGKQIEVTSISLSKLSVLRAPQTPHKEAPAPDLEEPSNSSGIPLGLTLKLDQLAINTLDIGSGLVGQPISYSVEANAAADPKPLAVSGGVSLTRVDGIEGLITAQATFIPNERILTFALEVDEPRGGLVASLGKIEGLPALDINLSGDGPLDDWAAALYVALDDQKTAAGTARITETGAGYVLEFALNGDLEQLAPPAVGAFVQGTTRASGSMALDTDFMPKSGKLGLKTNTVALDAEASFDRQSAALNGKANLDVSAGDGAVIALELADQTITFGPLHLDAATSGTLSVFDWHANVSSTNLRLPAASYQKANFSISGQNGLIENDTLKTDVAVDASVTGINLPDVELEQFDGEVRLSLAGDLDTAEASYSLSQGVLTTNLARIDLTKVKYSPSDAVLEGQLKLPKLAAFSTLAARPLSGSVGGNFEVSSVPQDKKAALTLSLTGHGLTTGISQADNLLGARTYLTTNVEVEALDTIHLKSVSLKGDYVEANATGELDGDTVTANVTTSLPDLSKLDAQINGQLALNADINGPLSAPHIKLSSQSDELFLAETPLTALAVDVDATLSPSAPSGSVVINGKLGELPLKVDMEANQDGTALNVSPLVARLGSNEATGAFTISNPAKPLETLKGELTLDAPKLSELSPLALTELSGQLAGKLVADDANGRHQLRATLNADKLEAAGSSITKLTLAFSLPTPIDPSALTAQLDGEDIFTGSQAIHSVKLTATPAPGATALAARVRLFEGGSQDGLDANATLKSLPAGLELALNSFKGRFEGLETSLRSPATITTENGTTHLSPLDLALGNGTLSVSGTAGADLDINASLKAIPVSLANGFVPDLGLAGTVSGTVKATGSPADPKATWSLQGTGLTVTPLRQNGLQALGLTSNGSFQKQTVKQQTKVTNPSGLSLSADGSVTLSGNQPLAISLSGSVPMSVLRRPLTEAGISAAGALAISGTINGSINAPNYNVTVQPNGLTATSLNTGMKLQNVTGNISATPDGVQINTLRGDISTGGTLSVSGSVGLADGMPADIRASVDEGRIIQPGLLAATVGANIAVKRPMASPSQSALVAGNVVIKRADISIPENLSGTVSPIAVQHVNAPKAVEQQMKAMGADKTPEKKSGTGNAPPRLDVTVSAPGRIFIRGRGLDAELQGSLKIAGTTDDPQAVGAFTMKRGQLDILTRRMVFSTGSATFDGSFTPIIDFAATTTVSDTQITVRVAGEADDPEISFTSSPERPQDEVLALLLFGKSVGNLSPAQIAQLAAAIQTLTGGSDNGPLAQIRKSLGLDAIDINTDSEGETSVSVGKYINDNIYLGVEQGTGSDSSRVQVDIDLDRGLKLRGEVGADGSSKAGIFFEREY
ncbi:putative signal peptide protein [Roseibium sp. TrichSKD4]|uniref:translocation/assembly module TamB domain-containing protein n=1 Tax=Roseibium sp. TrichSKD4 TaxID=744980 RepID=UPI0001E5770D|nr:translocation/assembly module TamB domain-containing protein [Roseibium sp. TrichSKD4]EFO29504.1 putative signal peptide protein [Roseibium sp. TrichSKD4]